MYESVLCPARIVWEYLQLKHDPIPADVIVAFGTNDLRVARFAARLYSRLPNQLYSDRRITQPEHCEPHSQIGWLS